MSNNLINAFNLTLKLNERSVTIERPGSIGPFTIVATSSNYFRNLEGPSSTVIEGREYVLTKAELDRVTFPMPRRGDRIVDADLGRQTLTEIREVVILGEIAGYRVRSS